MSLEIRVQAQIVGIPILKLRLLSGEKIKVKHEQKRSWRKSSSKKDFFTLQVIIILSIIIYMNIPT